MTPEEFNDLPLSARQYIENQQGCLSCGSSQDIDSLYKKYIVMKNKALFTLRTGAVPYKTEDGNGGVLYPIQPKDTQEVIKEKLAQALIVYAIRPSKFRDFDEDKIRKILEVEPADAELDLKAKADEEANLKAKADEEADEPIEETDDKPVKTLHGAAKKAAEAKAAKEAAGDNDLD